MTHSEQHTDKPIRLYRQSYIQVIHNAVGTTMFRNFYVSTEATGTFDALNDGRDACAFFVSAVLTIFGVATVHGTVEGTMHELQEREDWQLVPTDTMQAGDVLVWAPSGDNAGQQHIGFYVGDGQAVSNSTATRTIAQHPVLFEGSVRPVVQVFRCAGLA